MKRRSFLAAAVSAAALSPALAEAAAMTAKSAAGPAAQNPVLAPWTGVYGGVPAFDRIKTEQFAPAFKAATDQGRAEIAAIVANKAAPTFDNTIAALENSGRSLTRVVNILNIYISTMNVGPMRQVEQDLTPLLAAYQDEVTQNAALFARVKAVYDKRETSGLTPEQQRLTWVTYNNFARQGAALDKAAKARLGEINQKLATLYTTFSQNELADEEGHSVVLDKEADLDGLPDSVRAGAAQAAIDAKQPGKWVITNTRSSAEPFLVYSNNRALREKVWRMWISRGDNGDAHDNKAVITQIMQLRAEKAKLLGFPTYAHWITADQMAKTPDAAMDLMMKVWSPAVARVHEEVADMQKVADSEGAKIKIEPWDYRYYAEKVRKARYDLDENEVKPYLQLEKLREGMFWAAGQLYGFEFTQIHDAPVYQPDVRVFKVTRAGQPVGLWYFDPYARPGKQSGAWMNEYRTQERFKGEVLPIVSNNANFVKGKPGEPILVSWDDASTMFHEFGHALHGLNSNVNYPTLAGTNVARDFVEFPSQLNEHWLPTKEVLNQFAVHYQTGKPIPQEIVAKIEKAKTFNQGFKTVEYLSSAIYDMKIHLAAKGQAIDPDVFEKQTMAEIGMPTEIVMRHRPTQFGHIFSGDGYSSGYYDYIWADTLTADAAEAFQEAPGGFYDKAVAKRLHDDIMSVGNTIPADEAFRRFRGRDVTIDALMRDRGFPAPAKA